MGACRLARTGTKESVSKMASKRSVTPYFMVSGMALALVILAVLQYRWTKQVSEGERERLRSSLQVSVQQFRQEFTRDLMSLTTGFQVQYGSGEDHDWSRYARQGSEWLRNAPDARLVSAVYLWDFSANDKGQLYRLNREEQIFSTLETPSSLQPLLARLREHAEGGWRGRGFRAFSWNLDTDHPALFRNLSSPPPPDFRDRKMTEAPRSSGFIVIELDRAYLQRHFLPELASRYFATSEGFLYHVGVFANGDHNRPIFQTSEFTASSFSSADVNIGLLETRGRNGGGGGPGPGMEGPGGPFPPEGGEVRPPESRREDRPPQEARAGGFGRGRSFRGICLLLPFCFGMEELLGIWWSSILPVPCKPP